MPDTGELCFVTACYITNGHSAMTNFDSSTCCVMFLNKIWYLLKPSALHYRQRSLTDEQAKSVHQGTRFIFQHKSHPTLITLRLNGAAFPGNTSSSDLLIA